MSTFGEFFDTIHPVEHSEGQIWMEEWVALVGVDRWQEVRSMPLSEELVVCFAEDMLTSFRQRMQSICTEALYASTAKRGHEFLVQIAEVAERFGFDVKALCGAPATPSEAVAAVHHP